MLPAIKHGDRLHVVAVDAESRAQLVRGDIIVFRFPADPTKSYIKRLIGLPGEAIEIRDGEVWIDQIRLPEPYVDSKFNQSRMPRPRIIIPAKSYYVLGDNRDNSSDSRSWGFVREDLIYAKVVAP